MIPGIPLELLVVLPVVKHEIKNRKSSTNDEKAVSRASRRPMSTGDLINVLRHACRVLLPIFAFTSCAFGQEIKAEVMSAFVWGEDSPSGAISSTIRDPLTG